MVAVEGAVLVVRADIGDRLDLDIVGIDRPQQNRPLIADPEDRDADRIAVNPGIAEVERSQPRGGNPGGQGAG